MARVRESYVLRLKMIDLAGRDAAEREAELERLLISEPRIPYHLEEEPAIRATLIRLGEQEHVFILMMHHLVCDWSSEGVLWRELSVLYRGYRRNESIELAPLALQHGDYAVWHREQLTETALADDLAFWVENLRGAPPLLEVPSDRPRPQVLSYRGGRHRFRINRALTEAFRELSRREKKESIRPVYRGIRRPALSLHGATRYFAGSAHRRAGPAGNSVNDRFSAPHPRFANRGRERLDVPRVSRAGAASSP